MKILSNEETKKPFKPFAILIESADEAREIEHLLWKSPTFSEPDYRSYNAAMLRAEKGE
jgi:hypothetical protein